ncbi:hypothetical protein VQ042_11220 [Aurantimonas sp. A2-1-M11]|uniref:hypothetical protein n=1 Tax=Aurantimonas sp. A2-1-M11 TaxID=3113712 RepID=UPI002F940907
MAVWLALAASPTFMLMAGVAIADTPAMATCLQTSSRLSAGSMAFMYLLMGVFHLSPWLRLAATAPRL